MAQAPEARLQRNIRTARPKQVRDDAQDQGKAQPVEAEDDGSLPEAALADEVAQRNLRGAAVAVERVGIAHVAEEDPADEPDEEQAPADIFVRAEQLKEYGEHRNQEAVDR